MRWAWRVGRLAGIDVFVHFTFLFLLLWIGVSHFSARQDWGDALSGIGFVLVLFFIVVLHELGHALAAKKYGIGTKDITLLPIGGVARLDRMPEKPSEELVVAFAGPAVNVVLAGALGLGLTLSHGWSDVGGLAVTSGHWIERLFYVNVALVVFNLIPAFPMDGGRVLRALLAMRLDYVQATKLAAAIGQGLALLMGFVGLFFNPLLAFIALFVWFGAAQEAQSVEMKGLLSGVRVRDVMITRFESLRPDDPLEVAAGHVLAGFQEDFPVAAESRVVGVLTRRKLLEALARGAPGQVVAQAMDRQFQVAGPDDPVDTVFAKFTDGCCETVPVVDEGRAVGVLTLHNVGEYVMIGQAKREGRQRGAHPATS
ncbi:MAG: site-2 protease family protein [Armatimonadetes bacterium]|nr:site-2 protease family protein [Armatimonadota bacterium]